MNKRNSTRNTARCEPIERRQLLANVTGTIFNDINRNGRLDAGEAGLLMRTVYADYNFNSRYDTGEPLGHTDVAGHYTLATRASNVSLRIDLGNSEHVSLPYGATSIWLPNVGTNVAGQNFGIRTGPSTTTISGRSYFDVNNNGAFDTGETSFDGTVYADINNNGVIDTGEPHFGTSTTSGGFYQLVVPVGIALTIRLDDTMGYVQTQPTGFAGRPFVTSNQNITDADFGTTAVGGTIRGYLFDDKNHNATREAGEGEVAASQVWIDLDRDNLKDPGEPIAFYATQGGTQPGDITGVYLRKLPVGTWRIAMRKVADNDALADGSTEVNVAGNNAEFHFAIAVATAPAPTVTGVIFSDTNHNGRLDAGETRLIHRTVFADYNFNGRFDAGEPSALTDSAGSYSLATRSTNVSLRLVVNTGENVSLPYGATSLWLPSVNGTITGKNLGIASALSRINFTFFADYNLDSIRQSDEEPLAGGGFYGWLDLDGNTTQNIAAGEQSISIGEYTGGGNFYFAELAPGTHRFQIRSFGTSTSPYTNGSSIRVTVGNTPSNFEIGIRNVAPVAVDVFDDVNGNGV